MYDLKVGEIGVACLDLVSFLCVFKLVVGEGCKDSLSHNALGYQHYLATCSSCSLLPGAESRISEM